MMPISQKRVILCEVRLLEPCHTEAQPSVSMASKAVLTFQAFPAIDALPPSSVGMTWEGKDVGRHDMDGKVGYEIGCSILPFKQILSFWIHCLYQLFFIISRQFFYHFFSYYCLIYQPMLFIIHQFMTFILCRKDRALAFFMLANTTNQIICNSSIQSSSIGACHHINPILFHPLLFYCWLVVCCPIACN